jgi:large subunit ribosomal protein L9
MDVILLKDVEKVGLKGDVVSVARGYARYYLLPRRLAEPATPGRLSELRRHEELRARHEAQSVDQARDVAATVEQTELRFEVKAGPTGSLFGSVSATDVAEELWRARRIRVDRRKVGLSDPIKRIGRYAIPVELYTDVSVEARVLVVPEGGELPPEVEEAPAAEEPGEAAEGESTAAPPEAQPSEPPQPEALEPDAADTGATEPSTAPE